MSKAADTQVDAMEKAHDDHTEDVSLTLTGTIQLFDDKGDVRNIPVPSDDPNDPLNAPRWRKWSIIFTCCWFTFFSQVAVGGAGPIVPVWSELYIPQGYSQQDVIVLTTYPALTMACGALIILPLSLVFGRRSVMLGCCMILVASMVGAGSSQTYEQHLACRILQGIAAGAVESVIPLIISDVTFLSERGFWFSILWGTQNLLQGIFAITLSYLAAAAGWRWFYWLCVILASIGFFLICFLLPETRYFRSAMSINGLICYTDEFGHTHMLTDTEARERYGATVAVDTQNEHVARKTYLESLKPWSGVADKPASLAFGSLKKVFVALSSPAVVWALLAASISLGIGIAQSVTYGLILVEKFHWNPAKVGLINCGVFPAAMLATLWAGPVGDRIVKSMAKRRKGVHVPEDALIILIVPAMVIMIGLGVYGATANNPESFSAWGLIVGWTFFNFGFVVVIATTTHFAAEAYPSNPGPAIVLVVGLKNVISFGASYGIIPMTQKFNYLVAFGILLAILGGIFLLGIPVYFINPKWRRKIGKTTKLVADEQH